MTPDNNRHGMQHKCIVGFDQLGTADIFHHCDMWKKEKDKNVRKHMVK